VEAHSLRRRLPAWLFAGLACATLLGHTTSFLWLGELACGFRWHLGWAGLLLLLPLVATRRRTLAALSLGLSLWNLWPEARLSLGAPGQSDGPALELATANLRWRNLDQAMPLAWIREEEPDVVALLELTLPWLPRLEELRDLYPYQLVRGADEPWEEDTWGLALLSKLPLSDPREVALPERDLPLLEARIEHAGRSIALRTLHPVQPTGPRHVEERNRQLRALLELDWSGTHVLLGDLNATSYTPLFAELCDGTGLVDSRRGFGRQASWDAGEYYGLGLLLPLHLAIDHVLVSRDLVVLERRLGPYVGSDHLPVICRLAL